MGESRGCGCGAKLPSESCRVKDERPGLRVSQFTSGDQGTRRAESLLRRATLGGCDDRGPALRRGYGAVRGRGARVVEAGARGLARGGRDREKTRLDSSHSQKSAAV